MLFMSLTTSGPSPSRHDVLELCLLVNEDFIHYRIVYEEICFDYDYLRLPQVRNALDSNFNKIHWKNIGTEVYSFINEYPGINVASFSPGLDLEFLEKLCNRKLYVGLSINVRPMVKKCPILVSDKARVFHMQERMNERPTD